MKKKYKNLYLNDIGDVDQNLPINISSLSNVVSKIQEQYPGLTQSSIALIVRTLLEQIRSNLLQGNSIVLRNVISEMKLYNWCRMFNEQVIFNTTLQIRTPKKIKKLK